MDFLDKLVPYVLTYGPNAEYLNFEDQIGDFDTEVILIEDENNADFCRLLNFSNQVAFGGPDDMGMPLWVMLDCGILPTAMIGFMLHVDDCPDDVLDLLEVDDDYDGYVPISEYCASVSVEPGCVSGFSLHCQIPGHGLATRTKAFALAVLGAKNQIGVTQFDNPAIRVHARFGPMEIMLHRPVIHTHSMESFVYRLRLPDHDTLIEMARGGVEFGVPERPQGIKWLFDPSDEGNHLRLADYLTSNRSVYIVSPGWRGTSDGCEIDMIVV